MRGNGQDLLIGRGGRSSPTSVEDILLSPQLNSEVEQRVRELLKDPSRVSRILKTHSAKLSQPERYKGLDLLLDDLVKREVRKTQTLEYPSIEKSDPQELDRIGERLKAAQRERLFQGEEIELSEEAIQEEALLDMRGLGPYAERVMRERDVRTFDRVMRAWGRDQVSTEAHRYLLQMAQDDIRERVHETYSVLLRPLSIKEKGFLTNYGARRIQNNYTALAESFRGYLRETQAKKGELYSHVFDFIIQRQSLAQAIVEDFHRARKDPLKHFAGVSEDVTERLTQGEVLPIFSQILLSPEDLKDTDSDLVKEIRDTCHAALS